MASASAALPTTACGPCGFCRRNKEPESVFMSHQLRDPSGRVTCPQLFKYRCELCGATGAEAHTRSYCPSAAGLLGRPRQPAELSNGNSDPANTRTHRPAIQLTNARMYRNMGQVTSSRYNSAGRLRRPSHGQQPSHNPNKQWVIDRQPLPSSHNFTLDRQQESSFSYVRQ